MEGHAHVNTDYVFKLFGRLLWVVAWYVKYRVKLLGTYLTRTLSLLRKEKWANVIIL